MALTVVLRDPGGGWEAAGVNDATPIRHDVLVGVLAAAVVVERVHDAQIENHAVKDGQQLLVTLQCHFRVSAARRFVNGTACNRDNSNASSQVTSYVRIGHYKPQAQITQTPTKVGFLLVASLINQVIRDVLQHRVVRD